MKSTILVAVALVALAAAAPSEYKEPPRIIFSEFLTQPDSSYSYRYETEDGSKREETGIVKEALNEDNKLQKVVIVSGSYTFRNPEGQLETIEYFADETGYHAQGPSIPKVASRR